MYQASVVGVSQICERYVHIVGIVVVVDWMRAHTLLAWIGIALGLLDA